MFDTLVKWLLVTVLVIFQFIGMAYFVRLLVQYTKTNPCSPDSIPSLARVVSWLRVPLWPLQVCVGKATASLHDDVGIGRRFFHRLRNALPLLLFYWITFPSLGVMFLPGGTGWRVRDTLWMVLAVHCWIWFNIFGDLFSMTYTRDRIRDMLNARSHTLHGVLFILMKDLIVATLCFVLLSLLGGNLAYFFSLKAAWAAGMESPTFFSTVFSWDTVWASFGRRVSLESEMKWPAVVVTAATTYLPTLLWILTLLAVFFIMIIRLIAHILVAMNDLRDGQIMNRLILCGLIFNGLYILHRIL